MQFTIRKGQLLVDLRQILRIWLCDLRPLLKYLDGICATSEVDETGALVEIAEVVVGHHLRIALEIGVCRFEVAQTIQPIRFREYWFRIVRVDGDGILAAGDGRVVVFVHELGVGKRVPVSDGVGVVVDQLESLLVEIVVWEEVGYIIDIVCQLVGIDLFQLLPEELVGLFGLALTDQDFSFEIETLLTVDSLDACLILIGGFVVVLGQSLSCLIEQGTDSVGIVLQS